MLSGIAMATSEVGPAVSLFVSEVCKVLRFEANSVPRYKKNCLRSKYLNFKSAAGLGDPSHHELGHLSAASLFQVVVQRYTYSFRE